MLKTVAGAVLLKVRSRYNIFSCVIMDELNRSTVHIKNRSRVEEIINNMGRAGKDSLQVIADFDRTLSKTIHEGRPVACTYNALDESQYLPESYTKQATAVRDHYLAIEIDPNRTKEEKLPYMIEWWTKAHDLLLECHLTQDFIPKVVADAKIILREGSGQLFESLHKAEVPLLIFSAGVGDIIEEVLRQQYTIYDNMKVVSNFMDFDENGKLVGFKGEMIHVFNKNESAVRHSKYFEDLSHRGNIILLGDSLGDLNMADGCVDCKNILKIGFLNNNVERLLETYKELYDIVLVEDQTMEIANSILKRIL